MAMVMSIKTKLESKEQGGAIYVLMWEAGVILREFKVFEFKIMLSLLHIYRGYFRIESIKRGKNMAL